MGTKAATFLDGRQNKRVQSPVDACAGFVVASPVGTKGRSESDLAATILRERITKHHDELKAVGIRPPRIDAGGVVITPPGA